MPRKRIGLIVVPPGVFVASLAAVTKYCAWFTTDGRPCSY